MAEMVKKATRESFGETVTALAAEYPEIVVLDADLAAATKTGIFKKAYPERFFDCGIAECNMVGVAAGLATCGKIPFAASFAMFSAGRVPAVTGFICGALFLVLIRSSNFILPALAAAVAMLLFLRRTVEQKMEED